MTTEANDMQDRPAPPVASGFPAPLLDGYRAFLAGRFGEQQARSRALAQAGQTPSVMVIACCDSRAAPETIFDAGPGELFVVRNVANLVPPYSPDSNYHGVSAAVEYAVKVLKVRNIVVLGHARCGGIQAFADNAPPGDFIGRWISLIGPAARDIAPREEAPGSYLTRLEQASLVRSMINLLTFPYVRTACERDELALHGAYFNVASGELEVLAPESGRFVSVPRK
jgi:carbonic anhydrase